MTASPLQLLTTPSLTLLTTSTATLKVKDGRILVHIHRQVCVFSCLWDEVEFCVVYAFSKIISKKSSCITHQRPKKCFLKKRQHSNSKRVNILALAVTIQRNMMKCVPLSELSPTWSALCWFSFIWHHHTLSKHINGNLSKTAAPEWKVFFEPCGQRAEKETNCEAGKVY